jgi:hypothetical protein
MVCGNGDRRRRVKGKDMLFIELRDINIFQEVYLFAIITMSPVAKIKVRQHEHK